MAAGLSEEPANPVQGPEAAGSAKKRRRRLSRAVSWVGSIAAIVVLFAAWQVWGTALVEHHTQTGLMHQFERETRTSPITDRPFGLIRSTARPVVPPMGSVIGRIQIPAIEVDQYVVEGTGNGDLEKGPGHFGGTAVPGQAGNVAIAGRRTTYGAPFSRIDELRPGQSITLTTTAGEALVYAVTGLPRPVASSDIAFLNDFGDNRLTLSTSDPRYSPTGDLVVVAVLRSFARAPGRANTSARSAAVIGPPPGPLSDQRPGNWNLRHLPFALLLVALLVLLGLVNRRPAHRRRFGPMLLLGPIWIAGFYLLFVALSGVLPSTL